MSPSRISDEKRERHWQMLCAIASNPAYYRQYDYADGGVDPRINLCAEAWELVEQHEHFLAAKERIGNGIPAEDIDEEDGA